MSLIAISQVIGVATILVIASVESDRATLVWLRFAIGLVVFLPFTWGLRKLTRRGWLAAALWAVDVSAFIVAVTLAPLALVLAIATTAPLLAAVMERVRGYTYLTKAGITAVALGTAGSATAVAGSWGADEPGQNTALGVALAVVATFSVAAGTVLLKQESDSSPWVLTQAINVCGVVASTMVVLIVGVEVSTEVAIAAAVVAIGGGGLAKTAGIAALRYLPASVSMALNSVSLPLAAAAGWVLLGQEVTVIGGIGYLAVAGTVLISVARPLSKERVKA